MSLQKLSEAAAGLPLHSVRRIRLPQKILNNIVTA